MDIYTTQYSETLSAGNISDVMSVVPTVQELNDQKVGLLMPVIVIVIIFMLMGLVGNLIVCYIYYFRMKKTPSHYFVLFLATLDLISCCIGMPSELGDLFQPLTFSEPYACKFLRFVLSFTVISSCITLICVAFDRYYKVCKPLKSFPIQKVKVLCVVSVVIGLFLSWPALVLYGTKTVKTKYQSVNGTECSSSDSMSRTPIPLVYYGTLICAFIITFAIFVALYVKIGLEIRHRGHMAKSRTSASPASKNLIKKRELTISSVLSEDESTSALSDDENHLKVPKVRKTNSFSHLREHLVSIFHSNEDSKTDCNQTDRNEVIIVKRRRKSPFRSVRTTYIFLAVFIAFIVSFVPYLVANILKFTKVAFYDMVDSPTEEVFYNLCVRSYFISNFINPIIYSLLNKNFRTECRKAFETLKRRILKR